MGFLKIILFVMAASLLIPGNSALAYGGGSGGGVSQAEDSSFGGGAVSWSENPNGLDVMGSSIWHGRPESLEKGPYQPGKAVEDAEQDLLDGFKRGEYTKEEVKENLLWAIKAGIHISNEAQGVLDGLSSPTASSAGESQQSVTTSTWIDHSLYSHTYFTGDPMPDATAFALISLAECTPDSKMNSKKALAFLLIAACLTRGIF